MLTPGPWSSKRDSSIVYGVKRDIEVSTTNPQPLIVSLQQGDALLEVKLSRLEQIAVEPGIGQSSDKAIRIWSPVEDYPVTCEAIDAPAQELRRIVLQGPLPPGAYAIHWGGLTGGQTNEEQRIFCFRIVDPNAPPPAEEPAPAPDKESPKRKSRPRLQRNRLRVPPRSKDSPLRFPYPHARFSLHRARTRVTLPVQARASYDRRALKYCMTKQRNST